MRYGVTGTPRRPPWAPASTLLWGILQLVLILSTKETQSHRQFRSRRLLGRVSTSLDSPLAFPHAEDHGSLDDSVEVPHLSSSAGSLSEHSLPLTSRPTGFTEVNASPQSSSSTDSPMRKRPQGTGRTNRQPSANRDTDRPVEESQPHEGEPDSPEVHEFSPSGSKGPLQTKTPVAAEEALDVEQSGTEPAELSESSSHQGILADSDSNTEGAQQNLKDSRVSTVPPPRSDISSGQESKSVGSVPQSKPVLPTYQATSNDGDEDETQEDSLSGAAPVEQHEAPEGLKGPGNVSTMHDEVPETAHSPPKTLPNHRKHTELQQEKPTEEYDQEETAQVREEEQTNAQIHDSTLNHDDELLESHEQEGAYGGAGEPSNAPDLGSSNLHRKEFSQKGLKVVDPDDVPTVEELLQQLSQPVSAAHQTIKKPDLDKADYAAFKLRDLGLSGLVSVDPKQETGAFAISVGCGYFHDPPELPGLAHMLEHMIFLGSASQPQATSWDELINSRSGVHNAHTKPDTTTFYVTAPTQHIPELLDVFLQHLLTPALLPEQVQSEAMALQYEHEKNTPDLERVALHIALMHLPDSGTPIATSAASKPPVSAKFGTGSLDTLCNKPTESGIDLLQSLRHFHQKCYVPSNMSIAMRMGNPHADGSEHSYRLLDVVDIISTKFSQNVKEASNEPSGKTRASFVELHNPLSSPLVPTKMTDEESSQEMDVPNVPEETNSDKLNEALTTQALPQGTIIRLMRAHGWRRRLFIFWSAPAEFTNNLLELECQPSALVQHLLEHPVKGSLLSTLKQKGYITRGEAFKHWTLRSSITGLVLDTTEKGEAEHHALLGIVRQFTSKMQSVVDKQFVRDFFTNYHALSQLLWKFQDPLPPLEQVVASAENVLQFPSRPDLTLNTGVCISLPSEEVLFKEVRRLVEAMAPGKEVVIMLQMSESSTPQEAYTEVVEYGVRYFVEHGDEPLLEEVQLTFPQPLACKLPEAQVPPHPPPSVCVFTSARMPTLTPDKSPDSKDKHTPVSPPCALVSDNDLTILWHNGAPFDKSIVRSFYRARVSETDATAQNDALGKIFSRIFAEYAKVKLAAYHGCGVDLVVAYTGGSLVFELQSFSSIFEEVTRGLGATFQETLANVTEAEFNLVVASLKEETSDFSALTSYELAMDVALSMVRQSRYSQFDLKEQLQSPELTYENFTTFIRGSLGNTAVDCFVMGDIDASDAKALALEFVGLIRSKSITFDEASGSEILNLTADVEVVLKNPIVGDVNHAYVSLYVSEPPDILESVLYSTIGDLLRAPFFDTLRTINMDGYVAFASVTELPPVAALGTIVQPDELEEHVCTFLYEMAKIIGSNLSTSDFEQRLQWIGRSRFAREQSNFADFFSGAVSQVSARSFCFIRSEFAAVASENFAHCPVSLHEYLQKLVMGPSRRRITVKLEADAPERSSSDQTSQAQCNLPGQPPLETPAEAPIGTKRTQPLSDGTSLEGGGGKQRKGLVEQRSTDGQQVHEIGQEMQNGPEQMNTNTTPLEVDNDSTAEPLTLYATSETAIAPVGGSTELTFGPVTTTFGASGSAALSERAMASAKEEDAEALQFCANEKSNSPRKVVKLTEFAEKPQVERERLLAYLREQLSSVENDDHNALWTGFETDRYCTVREATVRRTATCNDSNAHSTSKIIQEDDTWSQLASTTAGTKTHPEAETAQEASDAAQEQSHIAASLQLETQVLEQQNQQIKLLQHLQQALLNAQQQSTATAIAAMSSSGAFLPPQASTMNLPEAGVQLPLQQQQPTLSPDARQLGSAGNALSSRSQPLTEGASLNLVEGLQAARQLQARARQLQMLQSRKEAIQQEINFIENRLLMNRAAPTTTAPRSNEL
ncbi:peptidase M16 domain-containing protein [Cyclospora cayetanensis]|uniref:Peptidase M16 domain-containing protein n=1 Tax=Cyclospora cayetanensis TaxID=88456 RepID=A0A1D3D8I3_9EIME|nr:peptidase M16 domain-containing protein [Cyclospora cayetanensis]